MSTRVAVTKADAEKVLAAVRRQFAVWATDEPGPKLVKDYDYLGGGNAAPYAIVWEDGSPYEWCHLFPYGGIEEEFGFKVKPVEIPDTVHVEPILSFILGIYER